MPFAPPEPSASPRTTDGFLRTNSARNFSQIVMSASPQKYPELLYTFFGKK